MTGEDTDSRVGGVDDTTVVVSGPVCLTHEVKVAVRYVYVMQSVIGDSGGGSARYSLTESEGCGVGGSPAVAVVKLREGDLNISPAVLGATGDYDGDGRFQGKRFALNYEAEPCVIKVAVSDLPVGCVADVASHQHDLVSDVDTKNRVVMRFDITCDADKTAVDKSEIMVEGPKADRPTG